LHLCPPASDATGIMFSLIFRCKLAGWWLVAYVSRSVGIRLYCIGGTVPVVSIQLLWLSFSVGRLPF